MLATGLRKKPDGRESTCNDCHVIKFQIYTAKQLDYFLTIQEKIHIVLGKKKITSNKYSYVITPKGTSFTRATL
jgi:hypothetical protein